MSMKKLYSPEDVLYRTYLSAYISPERVAIAVKNSDPTELLLAVALGIENRLAGDPLDTKAEVIHYIHCMLHHPMEPIDDSDISVKLTESSTN